MSEDRIDRISPWWPMQDPTSLKHLAKLGEEAAELCSIISRCIAQGGLDKLNPDTGKLNRQALEEELADVMAMKSLCVEHFALDSEAICTRQLRKMAALRRWMDLGEEK